MSDPLPLQIIDAVVASVTQKAITDVPVDDASRADIVKAGHLYQENPAKPEHNIYVTISHGDAEDPKYRDGVWSLEDMDNIDFNVPVREVGGGVAWRRRFTARFGVFLPKSGLEEREAMRIAMVFVQRIEEGIKNAPVAGLSDGVEVARAIFVTGQTFFESGGVKKKTYIWRGTIYFDVLTERL